MGDENESALLRDLDRALRSPSAAATIEGVVARVREHLALHPGSNLAWEPIPLSFPGTAKGTSRPGRGATGSPIR